MKGELLFLGTGASTGVPLIGCHCEVCESNDSKNKRLRPSVLININSKIFLIDAGPDFRQQALKYQIEKLDGVLFTHSHYDHISGIDELRVYFFRSKMPLPALLSSYTATEIHKRFDYIFQTGTMYEKLLPKIDLQILHQASGKVDFQGIEVQYFSFSQGDMPVNGFRFGDLAYLSDIRKFPTSIYHELKGVKTIIISALRKMTTDLHFSIDDAVQFINQTEATQGWITHISHDLDHNQTNAELPSHIKLAYDGLKINFETL